MNPEILLRQLIREELRLSRARLPKSTEIALIRKNTNNLHEAYANSVAYFTTPVPKEMSGPKWVIKAISDDGYYYLLSVNGFTNQTPLTGSITYLKDEINATGSSQAEFLRRKFPRDGSDFAPEFEDEKDYEDLIKIVNKQGPSYWAIAHAQAVKDTGKDSTGQALSWYGKYLEEPVGQVVDAALDFTSLAADLISLFPPATAAAQAVSLTISAQQIITKIAKGDFIGLLCDVIGLVPVVGKEFEIIGKRVAAFIRSTPSAVPSAIVDQLDTVTSRLITTFTKKTADSGVKSAWESPELTAKIKSTPNDLGSLASAGAEILSDYGVAGVIYFILTKIGVTGISTVIERVLQALKSLLASIRSPKAA